MILNVNSPGFYQKIGFRLLKNKNVLTSILNHVIKLANKRIPTGHLWLPKRDETQHICFLHAANAFAESMFVRHGQF